MTGREADSVKEHGPEKAFFLEWRQPAYQPEDRRGRRDGRYGQASTTMGQAICIGLGALSALLRGKHGVILEQEWVVPHFTATPMPQSGPMKAAELKWLTKDRDPDGFLRYDGLHHPFGIADILRLNRRSRNDVLIVKGFATLVGYSAL
ncbi:hypothetical protein [Asticcacaulis sp. MM231]|uniref:hypothetical protein n=1 Tax=Asticcacaulis sp. MM231 TaxID=3157666 RepID=UPI0032D5B0B9